MLPDKNNSFGIELMREVIEILDGIFQEKIAGYILDKNISLEIKSKALFVHKEWKVVP